MMNILQSMDKKMMDSVSRFNNSFDDKPKIFTLGAALFMSLMAFSMYPFPKFMAIFLLPAIIFLWVSHIYEWRIWFRENKQRKLKQPRFFPESVARYRKHMFFIALIFSIIDSIYTQKVLHDPTSIPFQGQWLIAYQFIKSILSAVIIIELIRLMAQSGTSWTNRKHILSVSGTSVVIFLLTTTALSYVKTLLMH
jgi:hypothetical protein